jgi:hypothetical protein
MRFRPHRMKLGTIAHAFVLRGRGVGVLFAESPPLTLAGRRVFIRVTRPDGFVDCFPASCELARVADARGEVLALLVVNATIAALAIGSQVTLVADDATD